MISMIHFHVSLITSKFIEYIKKLDETQTMMPETQAQRTLALLSSSSQLRAAVEQVQAEFVQSERWLGVEKRQWAIASIRNGQQLLSDLVAEDRFESATGCSLSRANLRRDDLVHVYRVLSALTRLSKATKLLAFTVDPSSEGKLTISRIMVKDYDLVYLAGKSDFDMTAFERRMADLCNEYPSHPCFPHLRNAGSAVSNAWLEVSRIGWSLEFSEGLITNVSNTRPNYYVQGQPLDDDLQIFEEVIGAYYKPGKNGP